MITLLFDIDGTLINSGGAGVRSIDEAFLSLYGIKDAMDKIKPDGMMDPTIFNQCYQIAFDPESVPGHVVPTVTRTYLDFLRRALPKTNFQVLPGVRELITHLGTRPKGEVLLGLGTGNVREGARLKLEMGDLWSHFPFGGFGEDGPARSTMLATGAHRGAKMAGRPLEPDKVFVIGDTPADCEGAHGAGFKCIGVATGRFTREELEACDPRPHLVLDDLTHLDRFLKGCGLT